MWRIITSISTKAPGFGPGETVTHRVYLTVRPDGSSEQVAYQWAKENGYKQADVTGWTFPAWE